MVPISRSMNGCERGAYGTDLTSATARTPPGRRSFAKVSSRWMARMRSSRMGRTVACRPARARLHRTGGPRPLPSRVDLRRFGPQWPGLLFAIVKIPLRHLVMDVREVALDRVEVLVAQGGGQAVQIHAVDTTLRPAQRPERGRVVRQFGQVRLELVQAIANRAWKMRVLDQEVHHSGTCDLNVAVAPVHLERRQRPQHADPKQRDGRI